MLCRQLQGLDQFRRATEIRCPPSMAPHAALVLRGEYEVDVAVERPTVLDIGANVGAFVAWALWRWPGCDVRCYEPHPANVALLRDNVRAVLGSSASSHDVTVTEAAVTASGDVTVRLYDGAHNCGEASLFDLGEQAATFHDVSTVSPSDLPPADIVKIDTEGCELEILRGYPHLATTRAVMLEWHRAEDHEAIRELLTGAGFRIVSDQARAADRGVLKAVR